MLGGTASLKFRQFKSAVVMPLEYFTWVHPVHQLVILLWVLGFSFVCLQFVCQIWGMLDLNILSTVWYDYADWSLNYLLSFWVYLVLVGLWHDFCILSRLVRPRNRRKDTLILQGESRNVQNV